MTQITFTKEQYADRAKLDLEFVVKNFADKKFVANPDFEETVNNHLEYLVVKPSLFEKLKDQPKSESFMKIYDFLDIDVKLFSPLQRIIYSKISARVIVKVLMDYYWIVGGLEQSLPYEMVEGFEMAEVAKRKEVNFIFEYKEKNGKLILVLIQDDYNPLGMMGKGSYLDSVMFENEDLMKKYRDNPGIIS